MNSPAYAETMGMPAVSRIPALLLSRCRRRANQRNGTSVHQRTDQVQHHGRSLTLMLSGARFGGSRGPACIGLIATAFAQDDARQAKAQWRRVAHQLSPKVPKLATLMHQPETDCWAT